MSQLITIAANFVAISILVFAIYFPRHRHRDMVVAYLGINSGVLAIATVLSSVNASIGVGIGLFGVLSIIRLRSDELTQRQVAYYFTALALGLLGGAEVGNYGVTLTLMGVLLPDLPANRWHRLRTRLDVSEPGDLIAFQGESGIIRTTAHAMLLPEGGADDRYRPNGILLGQ